MSADALRRRLAEIGGLSRQTDEAERRILAAAQARNLDVKAEIEALAPRIELDEAAAQRYLDLIEERGRLATIMAAARSHVAS